MRRAFRQLLSVLLIACLGFQPVLQAGVLPCAQAATTEPAAAADPHAGHAMHDPGAADAAAPEPADAHAACDCGCSCAMAGCVGVAAALPSRAHAAGPRGAAVAFPFAGAILHRLAGHGHELIRPPSRA